MYTVKHGTATVATGNDLRLLLLEVELDRKDEDTFFIIEEGPTQICPVIFHRPNKLDNETTIWVIYPNLGTCETYRATYPAMFCKSISPVTIRYLKDKTTGSNTEHLSSAINSASMRLVLKLK